MNWFAEIFPDFSRLLWTLQDIFHSGPAAYLHTLLHVHPAIYVKYLTSDIACLI
jgi:hypothetical protein